MGQKSATALLFGIIAAFLDDRTWKQAALARRLGTTPSTISKKMGELMAGGFRVERSEDHPHVYWSVPRNWFPGALPFKAEEVPDLIRLLHRTPPSALRKRVLDIVTSRLANVGEPPEGMDDSGVKPPPVGEAEERVVGVLEDALRVKVPVKMRYFTASRRDVGERHASVHRLDLGPRAQFVATCHKAGELRRFRVANVLDIRLDRAEKHRSVEPEALARFDEDTVSGYRQDGPAVRCAFVVRDREAAWVKRNLPDGRFEEEYAAEGTRFVIDTAAVHMVARFVVSLGEAARCETPELAAAVEALARGALANARAASPSNGGAPKSSRRARPEKRRDS